MGHSYQYLKRKHSKPMLGVKGKDNRLSKKVLQIDKNSNKTIKIFGSSD